MREPTHSLSDADRRAMLENAAECTFIWSRRDGWPVGVTMGCLFARERFWLVTGPEQPRVSAVRRDPRVSIVVREAGGRTLTAFGRCLVRSEPETRAWAYRAFAAHQAAHFPDLIDAEAFGSRLARLERVVFEVVVERWLGYDGSRAPVA